MASADVSKQADTDTDTPAEKQAPSPSPRKQAQTETQEKRPETQDGGEEDRRVHEITESSSDESADEAPRRTTLKRKTPAIDKTEKSSDAAASANGTSGGNAPVDMEKTAEQTEETREPWFFASRSNVADLHYLFTNDKLKEQPPAQVLRKDPFCIPRVTDNVPNYRPALNPLSIFMGEEKLLPGYFRLDPSERIPGAGSKGDSSTGTSSSSSMKEPRRALPLPSTSGSVVSTSAGKFRGKTSAFMGTMPRQSEFAEIPVSEKLFQDHQVLRPPALSSLAATSTSASFSSTAYQTDLEPTSGATTAPSSSSSSLLGGDGGDQSTATTTGTADTASSIDASVSSASVSDAMLLSSIQSTLDSSAGGGGENTVSWECGAEFGTPMAPSAGGHLQSLQSMDSIADTLTNYLPTRSPSTTDDHRLMGEHYFDAAPSMYSSGMSMGMGNGTLQAANSGVASVGSTFGSLLSPSNGQPSGSNIPYAGLFEDEQGQTGGTFSSALASTSLMTPTSFAAASSTTAIVTPHAVTAGTTPRRQPGPKKPRAKNTFRPCTAPGCTKGARGKSGLCQKHGGGKRCAVEGCAKGAQGSSSMCLFHGGGYRCTVDGCNTGARGTSGLCAKHGGYKRGKPGSSAGGAKRRRPKPASETSEDLSKIPGTNEAAIFGQ